MIQLPSDKCNQWEKLVTRKLRCICDPNAPKGRVQLCPCCAVENLMRSRKGDEQLSFGTKGKQLAYGGFLKGIRMMLGFQGVVLKEDGKELFGTHSLRRGGAQALAAAGWPLGSIPLWGRWLSDIVAIYVQDAEFNRTWSQVASSIVGQAQMKENTGGAEPDDNSMETFQGRMPVEGDEITFYVTQQSRWLRATIALTPTTKVPLEMRAKAPIWPIGQSVYLLVMIPRGPGAELEEEIFQALTLDNSTKWAFVGLGPARTRSGRVVKKPKTT